jgi:predicted nucleic acid-binding protein
MKGVLVDTNAYGAFRRGRPEAIEVFHEAPRISFSTVVLGELLAGFAAGMRAQENRRDLAEFLLLPKVAVLSVDRDTAECYSEVFANLRGRATPIPTNDIWVAATAIQHGLALFTYDRHFRGVAGLSVGASLADLEA